MFYTSMLGDVQGEFKRSDSFPIVFDTKGANMENVSVRVHNGKIWVSESTEGEEIFGLVGDDDYIPTNYESAKRFANLELADTEENPLVIVCTKAIRFYANTPCLIRTLFINSSMMLTELVYGACEFAFADGSFIPLQRCDDSDLNSKKVVATLDSRDLSDRLMNKTKGGWDKKYEMVNPMCIIYGTEGTTARYRFLKENVFIFNESVIKARVEAEEKERLEKAELEDSKKELVQKHLEEARQRHAEEDKKAAQEKARKAAEARDAKAAAKVEKKTGGRSVSAADFLSAVANAS